MDCRTAQLLLSLDRPHAAELSPEDRAQLNRHLVGCSICRTIERTERAADDVLGKAMRDVPVPDGLEKQLHTMLDRQERDERQRYWRRVGRLATAAAGFLALLGGLLWWSLSARPTVDANELATIFVSSAVNPLTAEEVVERFRLQGVTIVAPQGLDYGFCVDARLAEVKGRQVPMLLFDRGDGPYARVFILPVRQFDVRQLAGALPSPSGYRYRVETVYQPPGLYAYVYVYTGENLQWLRVRALPG